MFDGLSISITGSGRDAQSAVRGVRESLQDARNAAVGMAGGMETAGEATDELASDATGLSLALRGVKSQADEAGDQLTQAAAKATAAGGSFAALSASTEGLSLSMGTLSTTTTLSLIPALATLSTMAAPLAAGLAVVTAGAGSLAAAFGSVVGSGFLAWGRDLADQMEGISSPMEALSQVAGQLKTRLADAIAPLGQEMVPLLQDAAVALPTVVEEMVRAAGSTEEFRDTLRGFGSVAARVLPAVSGFVFDLARESLPWLRRFANFLLNEGSDAFNRMRQSVNELKPEFMTFLGAVVDAAPVVLEFGTNVADVVIPALTWLVDVGGDVMGFVNDLPGPLRGAAIAATILAPAILGVGGALSGLLTILTGQGLIATIGGSAGLSGALVGLTGPIGVAIAAVGLLAAAWVSDFNKIRSHTMEVMSDVSDLLQSETPAEIDRAVQNFGGQDAYTRGVLGSSEEYQEYQKGRETLNKGLFIGRRPGDSKTQSNEYLARLKELMSQDFSESFLNPDNFYTQGEEAGQAAAQGIRSGLQGVTIRSDGLTPAIRKALKQGVPGYVSNPSEFEDRPTKINSALFEAVSQTQYGATPESLGVSQQEYQILKQRYQSGTGGSSSTLASVSSVASSGASAEGMPSTGLSNLKPVVSKFETAVDKFAKAVENQQVVVTVEDSEFAQVLDARYEEHSRQTATQAKNYGILER